MKTPLLILSGLAISGLLPAPFSATRGGEKTAERLSDAAAGSGDGSHMEARDLFAAGDFSAWSRLDGKAVAEGWRIEDGVIHRHAGGGDIVTRESFQDFELSFEWKISEAGNSGVKYRSRGRLGLEYQILDDEKHRDSKDPTHRAGSLYDLLAAADDKPLRAVGEWNESRIVARGKLLEHWLNGKRIIRIEYGSDDWHRCFAKSKYRGKQGFGSWEGPILLQDHHDPVWFRNLIIRKLAMLQSSSGAR